MGYRDHSPASCGLVESQVLQLCQEGLESPILAVVKPGFVLVLDLHFHPLFSCLFPLHCFILKQSPDQLVLQGMNLSAWMCRNPQAVLGSLPLIHFFLLAVRRTQLELGRKLSNVWALVFVLKPFVP